MKFSISSTIQFCSIVRFSYDRFSSGGTITSGLDSPYSSETEEAGPVIVDPEAERRKREQKIENALRSSGVVTQARIMGFQESLIKLALKKYVLV